jgi:hypothetical protein
MSLHFGNIFKKLAFEKISAVFILHFGHGVATPGASFTKLTCVSDVTFGNFFIQNTINFLQQ